MRSLFIFLLVFVSFLGQSQQLLSLEEAIQIGLQNRYDITIATNQQNIAEINDNYGNAGFYPIIAVEAGQNFNLNNTKQELFSGDVREGNNVSSNATNAAIVLDWTFFDGMNMFIQKDRLEAESSRSLDELKLITEAAVLEIRLAFLAIQEMKDRIQIIQEAIDVSNERKNLVQTQFKVGTASAQALLQAQVDINSDSLALENVLVDYKNAIVVLNQSLNREPSTTFDILPTSLLVATYDYENMVEVLLAQNKNISMARWNEKLAHLSMKSTKSQQLPSLSFGTGYTYGRSEAEIGILKFNRNLGLNYGLTARWNIFDGFRVKNQTQTAKIQMQNATLTRQQWEMDLKSNIYANIDQMKSLQNIIRVSEGNVSIARENVTIAVDKLKIGSLTPLELRTAQQDLINISFQQLMVVYQLKRLEWNLLFTSGQIKI
ncbi:MAG: TolC family protein [Saprospiraceae bacterium]